MIAIDLGHLQLPPVIAHFKWLFEVGFKQLLN